MINKFLLIPIVAYSVLVPIGFISLVGSFQEQMGTNYSSTIWYKLGKAVWLPSAKTDSVGYITFPLLFIYSMLALPLLIACGLTGYFYHQTRSVYVGAIGFFSGVMGVVFYGGIWLWLSNST